jgi:hypothetical protein
MITAVVRQRRRLRKAALSSALSAAASLRWVFPDVAGVFAAVAGPVAAVAGPFAAVTGPVAGLAGAVVAGPVAAVAGAVVRGRDRAGRAGPLLGPRFLVDRVALVASMARRTVAARTV